MPIRRDRPVVAEELPRLDAEERASLVGVSVEDDPVPTLQQSPGDQPEVRTKPELEIECVADREGGLVLELREAPGGSARGARGRRLRGLLPALGSTRRSAATARPRTTAHTTSA